MVDVAMDRLDLAIVGGGIIGLTTALMAKRRQPGSTVAVFERSLMGQGATRYSARLSIPYGATPQIRALASRSTQLFRTLREEVPELPIRDLEIFGVCSPGKLAGIRSAITVQGADTLRDHVPRTLDGFRVPPDSVVFGGLPATRCADDSLADRITAHLESQAGTLLLNGTEIVTVGKSGDNHVLETRDGRRFLAKRLAVCIGPWLAGSALVPLPVRADVRTKKVVAFHIPIAPPPDASAVYLFDHDAFLLPQPERRCWFYSFRSEHWDCKPESSGLYVDSSELERAKDILGLYLPLEGCDRWGARIFCDAYTPTRDPLIERVPDLPCCVVAGGCSGSGIRLAPAIAERIVTLLTD
jgi:glycine/D-amino acid oxidase-like deaminating enzyme